MAEAAFRIQNSELALRPVWHQREDRVQAHILVCFLAYVLWRSLEPRQRRVGLGQTPCAILEELHRIQSADVVLPTTDGRELRLRCVVRPDPAPAALLVASGWNSPSGFGSGQTSLRSPKCSGGFFRLFAESCLSPPRTAEVKLGEVASHHGRPDEAAAAAHYDAAMTLASELDMRPLVAHCHLGLGKLCLATGKVEEAQQQLRTAANMYREMDMRFWLEKVEVKGETGGRG